MHASARRRNIHRTLLAYLGTAALGATLVHADDTAFDPDGVSAFVRVRLDDDGSTNAHRIAGDSAEMLSTRLVAEVYSRTVDGQALAAVDAADAVAETVADLLRQRSLPLLDYVTDPTGATAVTGYTVRVIAPPEVLTVPAVDGWARRIVTVYALSTLRHTG